MSMIYCHEHDRHVDTDFHEGCPDCLEAQAAVEELTRTPVNTIELIRSGDVRGADASMFTLAARAVTEEMRPHYTRPEHFGEWYVIYQSTDMHRIIKDGLDLLKVAGDHHEYAIGTPDA